MTITAGQTMLHYRLVEKIGEGGMGVVWKAVDTTLDRDVAIKVLPDAFAEDSERLARFEREAKLLASLNHANIATVHSIHEKEGVRFLAMEFVDGEDLAQRVARGAIPVEEALNIGVQIAEALEAAHDAGVIHRDLKPANIRLTPDGKVKVLDFGLAKALSPDTAAGAKGASRSMSPTVTSAGTVAGMILGTASYMSPEQARGRPVDRRADIWAFGCVMCEMLTGRRTFDGESMTDVLAAIVKEEPAWDRLPATTPPPVRRLLRRCLAKDPRQRLRDIGDARLEILQAPDEPTGDGELRTNAVQSGRRRGAVVGLAAGIVLGALTAVAILSWRNEQTGGPPTSWPSQVIRSVVALPEAAPLAFGAAPIGFDSPLLALSPDGRQLVYVGDSGRGPQLYRHDLDSFDAPRPIPGTEGALYAFFSPDGRWLGFLTHDKLKKVSLRGDAPQAVCDVRNALRASWSRDNVIWFSNEVGAALWRTTVSDGEAEEVERLAGSVLNQVLPDGRWALITTQSQGMSSDHASIQLLDLETLERRTLIDSGYDARYVPTGHLLFARAGDLLAAPFDAARLTLAGEPVPVVRDVGMDSLFGQAQVAVSDNGALAYVPGGERSRGRIARIDRQGNEEVLPAPPRVYGALDLSPDDTRLAVHVADLNDYIWIYDLEREEGKKLTAAGNSGWPRWMPGGDAIVLRSSSDGSGVSRLTKHQLDTSADPQQLLVHDTAQPGSWSPNGRVLALNDWAGGRLGFLSVGAENPVEWLSSADWSEVLPGFSPDGHWVAYTSDQTGVSEIWVRSYPDGSVVRQLSTGGGTEVVWGRDEIVYRSGDRWYASKVTLEPEFEFEPARLVFETDFIDTRGRSYDVSSDGQRLFVVKPAVPETVNRIHVVVNWFEELERLAPGGS